MVSIVERFKKREKELLEEISESRKKISDLTKVVQKVYSNLIKLGSDDTSKKCSCSNPEFVINTATKSKKICLNCAGH